MQAAGFCVCSAGISANKGACVCFVGDAGTCVCLARDAVRVVLLIASAIQAGEDPPNVSKLTPSCKEATSSAKGKVNSPSIIRKNVVEDKATQAPLAIKKLMLLQLLPARKRKQSAAEESSFGEIKCAAEENSLSELNWLSGETNVLSNSWQENQFITNKELVMRTDGLISKVCIRWSPVSERKMAKRLFVTATAMVTSNTNPATLKESAKLEKKKERTMCQGKEAKSIKQSTNTNMLSALEMQCVILLTEGMVQEGALPRKCTLPRCATTVFVFLFYFMKEDLGKEGEKREHRCCVAKGNKLLLNMLAGSWPQISFVMENKDVVLLQEAKVIPVPPAPDPQREKVQNCTHVPKILQQQPIKESQLQSAIRKESPDQSLVQEFGSQVKETTTKQDLINMGHMMFVHPSSASVLCPQSSTDWSAQAIYAVELPRQLQQQREPSPSHNNTVKPKLWYDVPATEADEEKNMFPSRELTHKLSQLNSCVLLFVIVLELEPVCLPHLIAASNQKGNGGEMKETHAKVFKGSKKALPGLYETSFLMFLKVLRKKCFYSPAPAMKKEHHQVPTKLMNVQQTEESIWKSVCHTKGSRIILYCVELNFIHLIKKKEAVPMLEGKLNEVYYDTPGSKEGYKTSTKTKCNNGTDPRALKWKHKLCLRYYQLSCVKVNKLKLNSKSQVANKVTKPLQGSFFVKPRDIIKSWQENLHLVERESWATSPTAARQQMMAAT